MRLYFPKAFLFGIALFVSLSVFRLPIPDANGATPDWMPEFPPNQASDWLNTQPLSKKSLAGKVVLIEVWTSV